MTDADNRPTPIPADISIEGEDPAAATAAEGKAFAGGTEIGAKRARTTRTTQRLPEDDSVVLAGIEAAQEQAARLRGIVHERRELARERIREQPLAAVAAAFAGGLIFGLLVARR